MRINTFDGYILVIDTDQYAGNFERELTAFVTGCIGECGVGQEQAEMFMKAVPSEFGKRINDIITQVPDDNCCYRPTSIYPTPNSYPTPDFYPTPDLYQSVAIFFCQKPDDDLLNLMRERVKEFCLKPPMKFRPDKINALCIRLIQEKVVTNLVQLL